MQRYDKIRISDTTDELLPLRELATVITVARVGSVTKAAEALGYAQPTVTLHLQTFERYIGFALFEREGRRLAITPMGRAVVERGAELLEEANAFRSSLVDTSRNVTGSVRVAALEPAASQRLPALVAKTLQLHPEINISVCVAGNASAHELVRSHQVDIAICAPPRGEKFFRFAPLFSETLAVLVPCRHRLASAKSVGLSDLISEKLLVSDEGCAYRAIVQAALNAGHVDVALGADFGTVSTLPYGVAAGLGIAIVPEASIRRPLPGTCLVPLRKPGLSLTVGTVIARDRQLSDPARCVLDLIAEDFKSRTRAR
jgi:LysR family transcriptional regulator, regulator of the ytmI operon